jgi:TonB-linked SusC/RagA family outer membrane protein
MMMRWLFPSACSFLPQRSLDGRRRASPRIALNLRTNLIVAGPDAGQHHEKGEITDMNRRILFMRRAACLAALSALGWNPANAQVAAAPSSAAGAQTVDEPALEEIVVTGYTTQKKKDIVGAIATVDLKEIEDKPVAGILQALQGEIPGVQINTDGNPGGGASVLIRGQGLGPLGFNAPLYIVDGVPLNVNTGLEELNPGDIASIQVLKDAASAAIYGARAANGVIVITTKHGTGHMELNVDASESYQQFQADITPLNTAQRAQAWYTASVNAGLNPNNSLYTYTCKSTPCSSSGYSSVLLGSFANAAGQRFIDPALTQPVSDTNWFKAVTQPGRITDTTVSLSNATDDSHFYMSVGYHDAKGTVTYSEMKRTTFRVNSDHTLFNDMFTVGENLLLQQELQNQDNSNAAGILNQALETQSIIPIYTTTGGYGGPAAGTTDHNQPVYLDNSGRSDVSKFNKVLGNLYAELRPLEGLTLRTSVGTDYSQQYYRNYFPGGQQGNVLQVDNLNTSYVYTQSETVTDTIDYKKTLWTHNNFDVLVGYENIDYHMEDFSGSGSGFASPQQSYTFLNDATSNLNASGGGDAWTLRSYFTNLRYDFDGKYLTSLVFREDGSSRFGANNRWGSFPSASVGWRLSQEDWFKLPWVNDAKLRLSDGTNGNQEIATNAGQTVYSSRYSTTSLFANPVNSSTCPGPNCQQEIGTAYDLNGVNTGSLPSGFAKAATGNPNLKWETSKQLNLGFDLTMFDNSFDYSFDVFRKRTSDILTTTVPLSTSGEGAQQVVNGGTVDNKGWEMELGWHHAFSLPKIQSPLNVHLSGNISHAVNTVKSLPADVVSAYPGNGSTQTVLGRSINSIFGYTGCGIFQTAAAAAASGQPGAYVGGLQICDTNHDGKITAADQQFFGSTDPKLLYGFHFDTNFQDFSFNMFWQGQVGGLVYNAWKNYQFPANNTGANFSTQVLGAWSPTNTGSSVPAPTLNSVLLPATYFWESSSYLKLRNVTLGYQIPDSVLSRAHIAKFRVYLAGANLLIIKNKSTTLRDPEEVPGSSFPIPKTYTLGFNGSF